MTADFWLGRRLRHRDDEDVRALRRAALVGGGTLARPLGLGVSGNGQATCAAVPGRAWAGGNCKGLKWRPEFHVGVTLSPVKGQCGQVARKTCNSIRYPFLSGGLGATNDCSANHSQGCTSSNLHSSVSTVRSHRPGVTLAS